MEDQAGWGRLPAVNTCGLDEDQLVLGNREAIYEHLRHITGFEINLEDGLSQDALIRCRREGLDWGRQRGWLAPTPERNSEGDGCHREQGKAAVDEPIRKRLLWLGVRF